MRTGFEVTAAVPKRLRAAEDAPVAQSMRGERRITQAPSTDQKKVRREMQRKTAVNVTAGDCRLCGGDLIPMGRRTDSPTTMRAQCASCGTKHELQNAEVKPKSAALAFVAFQNMSAPEQDRLRFLAWWDQNDVECPECHSGRQVGTGWASGDGNHRMMLRCPRCEHHYEVPVEVSGGKFTHKIKRSQPAEHGRIAANTTAHLLSFVGSVWVPVVDTDPYLTHTGMSAIARRAQSVLDTEEIL